MRKPSSTYVNRVAEFERSETLKKDTTSLRKSAGVSTAPKTPASLDTSNPYMRARLETLSGYPIGRRERILEMERVNNLDNVEYDLFVREIVKLGDSYTPWIPKDLTPEE
jgi:hypothetical protein